MKRLLLSIAAALLLTVSAAQAEVTATGKLNAIKPNESKVNLSHDPIPAIGWPAMTMDLKVAPEVDLTKVPEGSAIEFTLEKGPDGIFMIKSIEAQ